MEFKNTLILLLFPTLLMGVQIGDLIVPLNSNHAYVGQVGTVVDIGSNNDTTQAKLDFDGDGEKDAQIIVEFTNSWEYYGTSNPNDPDDNGSGGGSGDGGSGDGGSGDGGSTNTEVIVQDGNTTVNVQVNLPPTVVNVPEVDLESIMSAINELDKFEEDQAFADTISEIAGLNGKQWEILDSQWQDVTNMYQYLTNEQKPELLKIFGESEKANDTLTKILENNRTIDELIKMQDQNDVQIGYQSDINETLAEQNQILEDFFNGFVMDLNITSADINATDQDHKDYLLPITTQTVNNFIADVKTAVGYEQFKNLNLQTNTQNKTKWDIISVAGIDMGIDTSNTYVAGFLAIGKIGMTLLMLWGIYLMFFKLNARMLSS
jgi:hypothetical protein